MKDILENICLEHLNMKSRRYTCYLELDYAEPKVLLCKGTLYHKGGPRHLIIKWMLMEFAIIKCLWKTWRQFPNNNNKKSEGILL